MRNETTRQWLLNANPPSISEVIHSFSKPPLFFGFQMGIRESGIDPVPCIIDHAGGISVYDQVDNFILGFTFSINGNSMAWMVLEQVLNYPKAHQAVTSPVHRCALTIIEIMGVKVVLSIKFQWFGTAGLFVDTQMYCIDNLYGLSIKSKTMEFRWFPYHQAQVMLRKHMQFKKGSEQDIQSTPASLFPWKPELSIAFLDNFQHGSFLRQEIIDDTKPCTTRQCSSMVANEALAETDNLTSKHVIEDCESIWKLYKTVFLLLNGHQKPVYFSIRKPAAIKSANEYISIFGKHFEVGVRVSTTTVMNSCMSQLLKAIGIKTYSIGVDQYFLQREASREVPLATGSDVDAHLTGILGNGTGKMERAGRQFDEGNKLLEIDLGGVDKHLARPSPGEDSNGNALENNRYTMNTRQCTQEDQPWISETIAGTHNSINPSTTHPEKNICIPYHKQLISKNDKSYIQTCPICGLSIRGKKSNLLRHIANIHDKARPFVCPEVNCKRRFQNQSNLKRHISLVHNQKIYSCHLCTRSFKSEKVYIEHTQSAHTSSSTNLKCEICGGCFSKRSSLKRHFQLVHFKPFSRNDAPLHVE